MKKFILSLVVLSFTVTACTDSDSSDQPDRRTIAVIPKGTTHEFWKSIHAGALKAADETGVEIIWQGPQKEDDRQMQIQVLQNFISRGVDGIVIAPLDVNSLAPPVEAAVNRNIPVVIIDSDLDSDAYASFIATNNYEGGRLCARRLAEVLDGKGRVLMLRNIEGAASTMNREQGFLDEIENYPDIEVLVDNQFAGATLEEALQASQNMLNRFPVVDGVFCSNESTTKGMLRGLQTAGRSGDVALVGFDASEILINALESGEIDGLAVQNPFAMGYLGVKTVVAVLNGETVEKEVDTGVMMITTDNMDTDEAQKLLYPDLETWLGR